MSAPQGRRLVLLSRPGCGLCEEMHEELVELGRRESLPPLEIVDIDTDLALARRYILEIPVLLLDGVPASRVRLDAQALLRQLRAG